MALIYHLEIMKILRLKLKGLFVAIFTFMVLSLSFMSLLLPADISLANTVPLQRQAPQQIGSWNGTYTLLAPLGTLFGPTVNISTEGGISAYFDALFRAGIAIATGLALIMVMYGGFLYTSTDAITGKAEGKSIILQALLGLLLALTSVLILNQLNPALLRNDVQINALAPLPGINGDGGIDLGGGGNGGLNPVNNGTDAPVFTGGVINGTEAQRLDTVARNMIGKDTCNVVNTGNGKLACAYVVNDIVNDALGKPITGRPDNEASFGRLTADMYRDLRNSDTFFYAGNQASDLRPGDIIISPTQGDNIGHVGIYTSNGRIVSNSTSAQEVRDNQTPTSWYNYYTGKGLSTYIYRAGTPVR